MLRTRLRLSGRLSRGRRGGRRVRGRGARPRAPAGADAARRLDAGDGRARGAAARAGGLARDHGRDVQRLRGAGPRRAGARARGAPRSSRSRRRSSRSSDRLLAVLGADASRGPAGCPARRPYPLDRHPRRAPRAVPGGLRRGRDRHGDDDADRPAGARQPRARGTGAPSRRGPRRRCSTASSPTTRPTWSPTALDDIRRRPLEVVQLEHGLAAARRRAPAPGHAGARAGLRRTRRSTSSCRCRTSPSSGPRRGAAHRARSASGCWSRPSRTTRSSCSTRPGTSSAGTPAPSAARATPPSEIIGQHFRVFYPPEVQARRHPEHELELALRDGHYEEEGWRIRQGRLPVLGQRR